MKAPSSRHLSHDFPAYKGLTLRELLVIVISTTTSTCLLFGVMGWITGWIIAFSCMGFLLGFIIAVTLLPKPIARCKAGKPHGYLMKMLTLKIVSLRIKKSPYVHYIGQWRRTKQMRQAHV